MRLASSSGVYRMWTNSQHSAAVSVVVLSLLVGTSMRDGLGKADGFVVTRNRGADDIDIENSQDVDQSSSVHSYLPQRVRRKETSAKAGKPATCTCTCETMVVPSQQENEVQVQKSQGSRQKPTKQQTPTDVTKDHNAVSDYYSDGVHEGKGSRQKDDRITEMKHRTGTNNDQPENDINIIDTINKYEGSWGHGTRYPWTRLPDRMCYRDGCSSDRDCCMRYNICDRSAHVCVDCWYGSACSSGQDCCIKYPNCRRQPGDIGKCVDD